MVVFHYFHHPFWGPTPIFGNTRKEKLEEKTANQDEENLTPKRCEVFFPTETLNWTPPPQDPDHVASGVFSCTMMGWRKLAKHRKNAKKRLEGRGDVAAWRYGPLLHRLPLTSVFYNIMRYYLVGGWTDPLWKICNRQNGFFFLKILGWKFQKVFELPPPIVMNRFFDNSVGYFEKKIIIFKCLATTLEIQHLKCCLWVSHLPHPGPSEHNPCVKNSRRIPVVGRSIGLQVLDGCASFSR